MNNDLISRSALLEEVNGIYKRHYEKSCYQFIHDFFKAIFRRINKAPAVDAVKLSVRPGQMVWILEHKFPAEIEEICIREDGIFAVWTEYERGPELTEVWDDGEFDIGEIGKTVFVTKEDAEAEISRRRGEG